LTLSPISENRCSINWITYVPDQQPIKTTIVLTISDTGLSYSYEGVVRLPQSDGGMLKVKTDGFLTINENLLTGNTMDTYRKIMEPGKIFGWKKMSFTAVKR